MTKNDILTTLSDNKPYIQEQFKVANIQKDVIYG